MSLIEELEKLIKEWEDGYSYYDFYNKDDEERAKMEGKNEKGQECADDLKIILEKYKEKK